MFTKLKNRTEGFTIIEVLIVLAIAGLIMLVVFIAIPQLQRNQRNSARDHDASLIASAVSECLTNRNGQTGSCDAIAANEVQVPANLNQLTGAPTFGAGVGSTTAATWQFGVTCSADGTGTSPGTPRQYVVRYQDETSSGGQTPRCIAG